MIHLKSPKSDAYGRLECKALVKRWWLAENNFLYFLAILAPPKNYCFRIGSTRRCICQFKCLSPLLLKKGPIRACTLSGGNITPKWDQKTLFSCIKHIQYTYSISILKFIGMLLEKSKKASWRRVIMSFEKQELDVGLLVTCISSHHHHYVMSKYPVAFLVFAIFIRTA